jgi:hypothetical protein
MLENGLGAAGGEVGKRFAVVAFGCAMACGLWEMSAQARAGFTERLDQTAARAHAATLLPIIADDVIDGERGIMRGLPAGGDIGLLYRFRLRPEAAQYTPYCRMRIVDLVYEFARRPDDQTRSVADYDLLAIKRSGGFRSGGVTAYALYLRLSPAPRSREDQVARCVAADREPGWVHAADDYAFATESDYLVRLRTALAARRTGVTLRCRRDGVQGCSVSPELVLRIIEGERREFRSIRLRDQREIAEFLYFDPIPESGSQETRSIIVEGHSGDIESVTLVYGIILQPAI